jgi:tripartite-type tricarboxylate transporter receptor subunit TctC
VRRRIAAWLCIALVALVAGPVCAQDYPQRPVTLIVPFPPGAATDLLGRILAEELSNQLKQPFVVENKPGAGTLLGASLAAKAKPDGYTLLLAPVTTLAINPSVYKTLPYDPVKDFAPIGLVGQAQFVLIANPKLGPRTLPELIAYIKQRPGQMSYGSSGAGTPHHLFMEMFMKMAGLKMQHVPYRGSVAALTDIISGEIPVMIIDLQPAIPMIQDGKVIAFGVTSPTRVKAMPDIPTIAEAGLPGYSGTGWFSVVARAGTPRPIIDRLDGVFMAYLQRPEVQDRLQSLAIQPRTSTPDELEKFIGTEIVKWAKVVHDAGIVPQ